VRTTPGKDEALTALPEAISVIDRSVKKGILHRNTAARVKSKLVRQINAL
jgi:small subunit ribosomal protein S20